MARAHAIPPLVLVEWEDARVMDSDTWVPNEGAHAYAPQIHHQVGFLLSKTRRGLVLASTWSPEMTSARDSIPAGMVRSITHLRPSAEGGTRKTR